MSKQKILQILHQLRFSAGLSEEDIGKLADIALVTHFPAGATIFVEGSANPDFYLLHHGRVELAMNVPPRGSLPILTLGEGDVLGWTPALGQGQMTATATAIVDTQAILIPTGELQRLCEQDHDIGYEMMRRIAIALLQRLVATRLQVLDLFGDAPHQSPPRVQERRP